MLFSAQENADSFWVNGRAGGAMTTVGKGRAGRALTAIAQPR